MRVAVDARELCGRPTGVGRYLGEIVAEWARLPADVSHTFILCVPEPIEPPVTGHDTRFEVVAAPGRGTRWEQCVLPGLVRHAEADVLFAPGYSAPVTGSLPLVVAVHDVSFAAHPEWFGWREGLRQRLLTRAAARRAVRILTLTEFSRREIIDHLGVPAHKIEVVPPGITRPSGPRIGPAGADAPLVLSVGSIFNRRHVPELMAGFARFARRRPAARLVVVGENRTSPRIDVALCRERTRVAHQIELRPYVSEDALSELYARARAFVFLSEYEGFGLTPAEALAAGVPIVVLDTPVAREVYGSAALYVERPEPRLVERALEEAIEDESVRARVLAAAPAMVARYSWAACAARVLDVILEAGQPAGRG